MFVLLQTCRECMCSPVEYLTKTMMLSSPMPKKQHLAGMPSYTAFCSMLMTTMSMVRFLVAMPTSLVLLNVWGIWHTALVAASCGSEKQVRGLLQWYHCYCLLWVVICFSALLSGYVDPVRPVQWNCFCWCSGSWIISLLLSCSHVVSKRQANRCPISKLHRCVCVCVCVHFSLDLYEYYMDLCHESCSSGWLSRMAKTFALDITRKLLNHFSSYLLCL